MSERVVMVTGATGGLGGAIVDVFRKGGDIVVPVSRSAGDFAADLSRPADAEALVRRVIERYGRVDVLAHAVGAFASGGTTGEAGLDVWRRMMDLNFYAALSVIKSVIPHMVQVRRGRIVAVGSRAGVQVSGSLGAYSVSKAALHALIQTVALEVKEHGVTANAVLPSTIDTESNRSWGSPAEAATWVKPESIAGVIFWLASDEAADVNGALIPVYGRA